MSGATSDAQLFEDVFTVTKRDQSKYDRAARIYGTSLDNATTVELDINTEVFVCNEGDNIQVVIATSLNLDGSKDEERGWRDVAKSGEEQATLADQFEYVCHGKIYRFEDGEDGQSIKVYTSFGGLLMKLVGPYKKLTPLRVDYVYLLVKH